MLKSNLTITLRLITAAVMLTLLSWNSATAQKQFNNWVFGNGATVNFNTSPPTEGQLANPSIFGFEGVTTYSLANGKLRLYSNGIDVWEISPSGTWTKIQSGLNGNHSSTQSGVIIPKPGAYEEYYLITADERFSNKGVHYYSINLCPTVGNKVTYIDPLISPSGSTEASEKIAAYAKDGCKKDIIWVVAYKWATFGSGFAYEIFKATSTGISPHSSFNDTYNPPTTTLDPSQNDLSKVGQMTFSENGEFLATALTGDNRIKLHSFNPQTGNITNDYNLSIDVPLRVTTTDEEAVRSGMVYGVAFSPNNRFLYVTKMGSGPGGEDYRYLYQYDLSYLDKTQSQSTNEFNLKISRRTIYEYRLSPKTHIRSWEPASLQLGPDRKIYVAHDMIGTGQTSSGQGGAPCIGVINYPNKEGAACLYEPEGLCSPSYDREAPSNAVRWSRRGLPTLLSPMYCCPEMSDDNYKQLTDFEINEHTVFTGYYFIDKTITIKDDARAIMDNVVMVFAPNAGIYCEGNAKLTATNSVFKVCDQSTTWKGFEFTENSSGSILNCDIINAQKGVYIHNNYALVRIANSNQFINNIHGVEIDFTGYTAPTGGYKGNISDNVFTVDEGAPFNGEYPANPCSTSAPIIGYDFMGILISNARLAEPVSGNHFTYKKAADDESDFIGITLSEFRGVISGNYFTDNQHSISVNNSAYFSIDNNEFEQTDISGETGLLSTDPGTQIIVTNSAYGTIMANKFNNRLESNYSDGAGANRVRHSAIFLQGMQVTLPPPYGVVEIPVSSMNINQNTIIGYPTGIRMEYGEYNRANGNQLLECQVYGIHSYNQKLPYIEENTIEMVPDGEGYALVGMNFKFDYSSNPVAIIDGNYVSNARYGMYMSASSTKTLPTNIRNNALVDYTVIGMFFEGLTGELGEGCGPINAGKNLFLRYPTGITADIYNNSPTLDIDLWGNTFNDNSTILVDVNPDVCQNSEATSTSEGVNIVRREENLSASALMIKQICNTYNLAHEQGMFKVKNETYTRLSEMEDLPLKVRDINSILSALSTNMDMTEATAFYKYVVGNNLLENNDLQWFKYRYAFNMHDYNRASAVLASITPANEFEADKKKIETILTNLQVDGRNMKEMSESEKKILQTIDDKRSGYCNVARAILQSNDGKHSPIVDYIYIDETVLKGHDMKELEIFKNPEQLVVYPNPSSGNVKVYVNLEEYVPTTLAVSDITGRQITAQYVRLRQGVIDLDLSSLEKGTYSISLISNDGQVVKSVKMIKTE